MNSSSQAIPISAQTRISTVLRAHPEALETIAAINPHFEKLRNPFLRRVLASRVTIADAARIGGTKVGVFFEKLAALGFVAEGRGAAGHALAAAPQPELPPVGITLDVRQALQNGHDPFKEIMAAADQLPSDKSLLLINTFEPIPLYGVLGHKGFGHYTSQQAADLVHTYFYRTGQPRQVSRQASPALAFDRLRQQYQSQLVELDVRHLEMPGPMVTVLEALNGLSGGQALLVVHRRVPQYLLNQLPGRGFAYALRQDGPDLVQLLIYKISGHEPVNG